MVPSGAKMGTFWSEEAKMILVLKVNKLLSMLKVNLTDILIDIDKFREMTKNIYDAIDTDNEGTIRVNQVEDFVRKFLKGNQIEGQTNTAFDEEHDHVFKILTENESGEVNLDELGKFISELLKNQVKVLQIRLEAEKHERSVAM